MPDNARRTGSSSIVMVITWPFSSWIIVLPRAMISIWFHWPPQARGGVLELHGIVDGMGDHELQSIGKASVTSPTFVM